MSGSGTGANVLRHDDIIHDWNVYEPPLKPAQPFDLNDETLRDGVQSPSVVDPDIDSKLKLLELMHSLGIRAADIGLPGAGKRAFDDVVRKARYIDDHKLDRFESFSGSFILLRDALGFRDLKFVSFATHRLDEDGGLQFATS